MDVRHSSKNRTSSMNFKQRLLTATKLGKNMTDAQKLNKVAEMFNVPITTLRYRLQYHQGQQKKKRLIQRQTYSSSDSSLEDEDVLQTSDLSDDEHYQKEKKEHCHRTEQKSFRNKRAMKRKVSPAKSATISRKHRRPSVAKQPSEAIVISSDSEDEPVEVVEEVKQSSDEEEEAEEDGPSENKLLSPEGLMRRQALGLRLAPKRTEILQIGPNEKSTKKSLPMPFSKSKVFNDVAHKKILVKPIPVAAPSKPVKPQREVRQCSPPPVEPSSPPTVYYDQEQTDNIHYSSSRKFTIAQIMENKLSIHDMCLVCGTTQDVTARHPVFSGGLCESHNAMFKEWYHVKDPDGYYSYCAVCCMGKKVVLCTTCDRCCCEACLVLFGRREYLTHVKNLKDWKCLVCSSDKNDYVLLEKHEGWQTNVQNLMEKSSSQYLPFHIPKLILEEERRPLCVLSLFDGIATGMLALKDLGFQIESFVASEINEDAIKLVRNRHNIVHHVGDVTKISDEKLRSLGPFDLLLGGSPCNDLSGANPRRRGLIDPEGTGILFFHFYRALRTIEPEIIPNKTGKASHQCQYVRPFFWLFENVNSMRRVDKNLICSFLQCQPTFADAKHVSAACRPRLFWGNIPGLQNFAITPLPSDKLTVQDCLEVGRTARFEKINTITAQHKSLFQGQNREQPVLDGGKYDILWTTEIERVFGVPQHYTDINNLGPRERLALLGRSWSVPVIKQLLRPLQDYFAVKPSTQKQTSNSIKLENQSESQKAISNLVESEKKKSNLVKSEMEKSNLVKSEKKKSNMVKSETEKSNLVKSVTEKSNLVESGKKKSNLVESEKKKSNLAESEKKKSNLAESEKKKSNLVESEKKKSNLVESEKKKSNLAESEEKSNMKPANLSFPKIILSRESTN